METARPKPTAETLRSLCPDVDERLIEQHLARLDEDYFVYFSDTQIARHLSGLTKVSPDNPVEVQIDIGTDREADCTVLAFDYPSEFSMITGVLAGTGFAIRSGDVFTYARSTANAPRRHRRPGPRRRLAADPMRRRRIIDCFAGHVFTDESLTAWREELRKRFVEIFTLLEQANAEAVLRAKHRVNEMVTQRLEHLKVASHPVLYPVHIEVEQHPKRYTRVCVVSQDTPAFLYALSTALSLHGLVIEGVRIRTVNERVEDELDLVDGSGAPILDEKLLDKVRLSVLLTKQFTYFLDKAPDPYTALSRFDQMLASIIDLPESGKWIDALSNPRMMQDLARLLGASDYIWEDFIRLQYESLLPILTPHLGGRPVYEERGDFAARLERAMKGADDLYTRRERLNQFKNREIFLIDLDHVLTEGVTFRDLAERLSALAEVVVNKAADLVYENLVKQYGTPKTVGGLEATYAILGLGKLGGAALGYASDIELLFVYSDSGQTDGENAITNAEFFGYLAEETALFIQAKRRGIFRVDLRLRPHGNSGPKAASLESFCTYYASDGDAHAYERLALVRMRAIGGHRELGEQLERLRDEFVYSATAIDIEQLQSLRKRQFEEKNRPGVYNAKFSPGALVDIEYTVQILQVLHAGKIPGLRTPRIHEALEALKAGGVLETVEYERLNDSYDFLRQLINGLRMLRGSAEDLYLPPADSEEFVHLARRMGYQRKEELEPAQQLHVAFDTCTAAVRTFVERHFGRESLPGPGVGNVADLVLSDQVPEPLRRKVLASHGFRDVTRAYVNLCGLAGTGPQRDRFASLAVLACDILRREPDPDMALNNWERFSRALPDTGEHYERLLWQPRRLEVMLAIFSRSQFLGDALIRTPELWDWVTAPENLQHEPTLEQLQTELAHGAHDTSSREAWQEEVRRFRRREVLRIGVRDMCLRVNIRSITRDLSTLADAIISAALDRAWHDLRAEGRVPADPHGDERFCILAFGKLGGQELNYSSDVDLLAVYEEQGNQGPTSETYARVLERLHQDLTKHTVEGHAYRVDLRLRPHGGAGEVVASVPEVVKYYRHTAALWEQQALLKLRPVAGCLPVGEALVEALRPLIQRRQDAAEVVRSIHHMRDAAVQHRAGTGDAAVDVKSGIGGIRDVEFLVQGLQLMHAAEDHPELITGNTLEGLERIAQAGILSPDAAERLREDYVFLRRVEHYLQILEDRQIHAVPAGNAERQALGRRVLGPDTDAGAFMEQLRQAQERVREAYLTHLESPGDQT